jgi:hypothetical protein
MSDAVDDFIKNMPAMAAEEDKKREVQAKKLLVDENRYSNELARITKTADETARAQNTSFDLLSQDAIEKIQKDNMEYIQAARKALRFINREFDAIVGYFRKNLILIGAYSGHGKSTAVANIARETLRQISKVTNKPCKVLIITNEEKTEDVFNRITCLIHGWNYVNHDKFTDEQIATFHKFIPILGKYMTVVDDNFNGVPGTTTSLEGICGIFDNMIRDGTYYDSVLFDYYQNVTYSKENPKMSEFEVQALLSHKLDQYKNTYNAPITVMAQCDPPDDANTPFMYRIKGRKLIFAKATMVLEMVAEQEKQRTTWTVWKSRFTNSIGKEFHTTFDKGKILPYDPEMAKKIMAANEEKEADKIMLKNIGTDGKDIKMIDVTPKKE